MDNGKTWARCGVHSLMSCIYPLPERIDPFLVAPARCRSGRWSDRVPPHDLRLATVRGLCQCGRWGRDARGRLQANASCVWAELQLQLTDVQSTKNSKQLIYPNSSFLHGLRMIALALRSSSQADHRNESNDYRIEWTQKNKLWEKLIRDP